MSQIVCADTTANKNAEEDVFPINLLPPELREMIWQATLPLRRIFHVCHEKLPRKGFCFHAHPAPPVATQVCGESRRVALRQGFYMMYRKKTTGVWFNPEVDMLYFDRNLRSALLSKTPSTHITGWERVLHVGIEWRAFFLDAPRPTVGHDIGQHWRTAINTFRVHVPCMVTLHYILPVTRHRGGMSLGREFFGAHGYPTELKPLPDTTKIPWDSGRGMSPGGGPPPQIPTAVQLGPISLVPLRQLRTWLEVKEEMQVALENTTPGSDDPTGRNDEYGAAQVAHTSCDDPLQIQGWHLLRMGWPKGTVFQNPQVQDFLF